MAKYIYDEEDNEDFITEYLQTEQKEIKKTQKRSRQRRRTKEQSSEVTPFMAGKLKQKKRMKAIILIVVLFVVGFFFFKNYKSIQENKRIGDSEFIMPNISGFDVESASTLINECGADVEIVYEDDPLYMYDTVIKSDYVEGDIVSKSSTITLTISNHVNEETTKKDEAFVDWESPLFKNNLEITSFDIKEEEFEINFINNNDFTISNITCTILYNDCSGDNNGMRVYYYGDLSVKAHDNGKLISPVKSDGTQSLRIGDIKYESEEP